MGKYKATWIPKPYGPGKWQLFDMSVDPGETNALSPKAPELKTHLVKAWDAYAESVGIIPSNEGFFLNK
jgi:arylsulfatase